MKRSMSWIGVGIVGAVLLGSVLAARQGMARQDPQVKRPIVVVDAGHGASDAGAIAGGAREKDVNLAIAKALQDTLAKSGVVVRMTRSTDTFLPLTARARVASEQKADVFLSIHSEAPSRTRVPVGAVVYHHGQNPIGRQLASAIARQLIPGVPSASVRSDATISKAGFAVLRNSPVPAILVSVGDVARLSDASAQREAAAAIATGLREYVAASEASKASGR